MIRVFLRFCHRQQVITKDLSGAVEMPQSYRLADVPRSITWDEVRRMLEAVDRRTALGRRDYAILLLLVTYGLRAHEVAKLTLDDIDWKRERLQIPERKAGHWTAYPLANVVAEALDRVLYVPAGRKRRIAMYSSVCSLHNRQSPTAPFLPPWRSTFAKRACRYAGQAHTRSAIRVSKDSLMLSSPLKRSGITSVIALRSRRRFIPRSRSSHYERSPWAMGRNYEGR